MDEITRIKEAYARRDISGKPILYSVFNPAALLLYQQREKSIIEILKKEQFSDLADKKILDVGCGKGGVLRDFIRYGATPSNCYGIDILPDRIDKARELSPNIDFQCGSAEDLSYQDEFFHIILQFMVFTSILDSRMKIKVAAEMLRVLNPNGIIIWYDYFINNPRNPDVRGVKKKEILHLFQDCEIYLERITFAPPIARVMAPFSPLLCQLLEKIPLLCTHYLGVIKKGKQ